MSFIERSAGFPPAGSPAWPLCRPPAWRGGAAPAPAVPSSHHWWHPDAVFALAFEDSCFMHGAAEWPAATLLATTRASGILLPDAVGHFQPLGANVLPHTDRGLYVNGPFSNLAPRRDPALAQLSFSSNVTDAAGFAGLPGSLRFPGSYPSGSGIVYQQPSLTAGQPYFVSVLVQMEGGEPPVFGSATPANGANSFYLVLNGGTSFMPPPSYSVTPVAEGIWRVSAFGTAPATNSNCGVIQTPTNQARAFRICGYQIFAGSAGTDALVPGSADTGGGTLNASDVRAVQGVRPSDSAPEPFPGFEAAGLDAGFVVSARVVIGRLGAAAARAIAVAGADADNAVKLIFDTDNRFRLIVRKAGVNEVVLETSAAGAAGTYDLTFAAMPGAYALDATGLTGDTEATVEALPSGMTTLRIGSDFSNATPFNGWIEELQITEAA